MELSIPKVVRPLSLSEYVSEMAPGEFQVWVNPPYATRTALIATNSKIRAAVFAVKEINDRYKKKPVGENGFAEGKARIDEISKMLDGLFLDRDQWVSEILSQGPEATRISFDDITKIRNETFDSDPRFFEWLVNKMFGMIDEHRRGIKKV